MRFPAKITSSCIWVAIPVDWVILHWYACDADGRTVGLAVGRCTVTWLPNFLGWVDYHIFLPIVLRCARLARKSFAIKLPVARNTILPTNWADLEQSNRLVEKFGSPRPPPDHALAAVSKAVVVNLRIQPYLQGEVPQKKIHTEKKNLWEVTSFPTVIFW